MLRALLLASAALAAMTTYAEAGACLSDDEIDDGIALLERSVKKPATDLDYYGLCLPGALDPEDGKVAAKRIARINAACSKILPERSSDTVCLRLAALQGKAELGGVQIFDAIVAWNSGPWSGPRLLGHWSSDSFQIDLDAFVSLRDARAVPLVLERWAAFETEAVKREASKRGRRLAMMAWASWRKQAAALLGALGGEAEAVFLEGQAKATKDRHVKQACLDAVKAIRARAL